MNKITCSLLLTDLLTTLNGQTLNISSVVADWDIWSSTDQTASYTLGAVASASTNAETRNQGGSADGT